MPKLQWLHRLRTLRWWPDTENRTDASAVRFCELAVVPPCRLRVLGFAPVLTTEVPAAILHFRDDGAAMVACWGTLTTCDVTLPKGWVGLATTMHTNIGV